MVRGYYHSLNAPLRIVVDKWVMPVPPSIGDMQDIPFREVDRNITVSMSRRIVLQLNGITLECQ